MLLAAVYNIQFRFGIFVEKPQQQHVYIYISPIAPKIIF